MEVVLMNGAQLPLAPGTLPNCFRYRDQFASRASLGNPSWVDPTIVSSIQNYCEWVTREYFISLDELIDWNPSLSNDNDCELQPGYSYCVVKTEPSDGWIPLWSNPCFPNGVFNPDEIMDGTDPECNCFEQVSGQDLVANNPKTCSHILEGSDVPIENLHKYNSWIDMADCDGSLYAGMAENEIRAVCIGKFPSPTESTVIVTPTPVEPPTCTPTFDPKRGEYVCPDPPICSFDPKKGEYICPEATSVEGPQPEETEENSELRL